MIDAQEDSYSLGIMSELNESSDSEIIINSSEDSMEGDVEVEGDVKVETDVVLKESSEEDLMGEQGEAEANNLIWNVADAGSDSEIIINSIEDSMEGDVEVEGDVKVETEPFLIESSEEGLMGKLGEAEANDLIGNVTDAGEEFGSSFNPGSLEVGEKDTNSMLDEHDEVEGEQNDLVMGDINMSDCSDEEEEAEEKEEDSIEESSSSSSENNDGDSSNSDSDEEQDNVSELGGDLKTPLIQGWRRECLTWEGKVVRVYYLSPGGRADTSKRMRDMRGISRCQTTWGRS